MLKVLLLSTLTWSQVSISTNDVLHWFSLIPDRSTVVAPTLGVEIEGRYISFNDHSFSEIGIASLGHIRREGMEEVHFDPVRSGTGVSFLHQALRVRFQFVDEMTLSPVPGFTNFELNSWILKTSEDRRRLLRLSQFLWQKFGAISVSSEGGVHIHVGMESPNRYEIALLTIVFNGIHDELKSIFQVSDFRERNYAKKYDPDTLDRTLQFLGQNEALLEKKLGTVAMNPDRHFAINWRAYERHGTVEIRIFNSTLNPFILDLAMDFVSRLVQSVRYKSGDLRWLIQKYGVHGVTLQRLAYVIGAKIGDHDNQRRLKDFLALDREHEKAVLESGKVKRPVVACEFVF